jgi:glycosyltransferase involved in cell wall biosynthesis
MRIAIFDYKVTATNPVGSCHLELVRGLHCEHSFTVFAVKFENPAPDRVGFVRVPVPTRPLALLYLSYHLVAPIVYLLHRVRGGGKFDLLQIVTSKLAFGDVSYAHFCHRYFLRCHWVSGRPAGFRRWVRWIDHKLQALVEPWVYRRVERVVVPSRGLARELGQEYPFLRERITVIPNPVDVDRYSRAGRGEVREKVRKELSFRKSDRVFVFVALGQFERKGLPILLDAIRSIDDPGVKLLVVGGTRGLVTSYRADVDARGLSDRVVFVGVQADVAPFLWASDASILASSYEVFPLVTLQAAAAGLAVLATPLNGVEEFVRHGHNGMIFARSSNGAAEAMRAWLSLDENERSAMARAAESDVMNYRAESFADAWRSFYRR